MGLQPITPPLKRTRLEELTRLYLEDRIDVEKFEETVGDLLEAGIADEPFLRPRPNRK